jgi:hypothetical protein
MRRLDSQMEFDFSRACATEAESDASFDRWRAEMKAEDEAEARRLGLPLRRRVEVQLECGALLRGRLLLAHPELLRLQRRPARLEMVIGDSLFDHSQIARCLVLDDAGPADAPLPQPETARTTQGETSLMSVEPLLVGTSSPAAAPPPLDALATSCHTPNPEPNP